MAILAKDAIAAARSLIGTPYAQMDCINLIKKVIRIAPGGEKSYTIAGTNALWRSYDLSGKYRDLTWRQEGLLGAKAGMVAFKARGTDWRHVGLVTGEGTVIHSSSTQGGRGVVETPLVAGENWTHLAIHRMIETGEKAANAQEEMRTVLYQAIVATKSGPLNLRQAAVDGKVIGKIPKGAMVDVYSQGD